MKALSMLNNNNTFLQKTSENFTILEIRQTQKRYYNDLATEGSITEGISIISLY